MFHNPALLHSFLDFLTEQLIVYASYQIESGAQVRATLGTHAGWLEPNSACASSSKRTSGVTTLSTPCSLPQVIQLFDSWAHHLSPAQFAEFSLPYAERIAAALKAKYPHVPVILHGNGGTGAPARLTVATALQLGT
jgi:uroporphyrinogen decarboxylase